MWHLDERTPEYDVVAIGEPLVQFSPLESGPLSYARTFDMHAAGAESNVLIGISRLGHRTALITKVGTDELSRFILTTLRGEGVDTRWVVQVPGMTCGAYVAQRNYPVPEKSDVIYFRRGSAASTISVKDVPEEAVRLSRIVHLSGITPALSSSCKNACLHAARLARDNGAVVSFDPNYRKKLWQPEEAAPVFRELVGLADIVFLDRAEASMILREDRERRGLESTLRALVELGPGTVVLKLGTRGMVALRDGRRYEVPAFAVSVVDVIGAGDAVVSGFLSGTLYKKDIRTCLQWGAACSALVVMRRGDFENLPTLPQLQTFLTSRAGREDVDLR